MKLRDAGWLIGVLFAVVGVTAVMLMVHGIRYIQRPLPPAPAATARELLTGMPQVERLPEPWAILILDVSGSMASFSDPEHLQTAAVLTFFDVYSRLAREVLDRGERAWVAVVLFATVAQVIDWTGRGEPFLEATPNNEIRFREVIVRHLGEGAADRRADPRRGQDTDYAAALEATRLLVEARLRQAPEASPPLVLLMTDGICEPHALFTPLRSMAERQRRPGFAAAMPWIERFAAGKLHFLPADPRARVFQRNAPEIGIGPDPIELGDAEEAYVRRQVDELLARSFLMRAHGPSRPMVWAPLFLNARGSPDARAQVERLLAGSRRAQEQSEDRDPLIICRSAEELHGEFVRLLARWFRLLEAPLRGDPPHFLIPRRTQAFAVHLRVNGLREGDVPRLERHGRRIPLRGGRSGWSTVVAGDCAGTWRVVAPGARVVEGRAFIRPRWSWTLAAPEVVRIGDENARAVARIFLARLKDRRLVAPGELAEELPAALPGRVRAKDGAMQTPLIFRRVREPTSSPPPTYEALLPLDRLPRGEVIVEADLGPLRQRDLPVLEPELRQTIRALPALRVEVLDPEGRPSAIHIRGIPAAPRWLLQLRDWLKARITGGAT
jgi:hypothetical protein